MAIAANDSTPRSIVPPDANIVRPPRTDDYAIVIGINDYPWFRGLRGAVRDAIKVAAWLRHPRHGAVAKHRLRLVTSTPAPTPVQRDVDDALTYLLAEADRNGGGRRLYFYFAGHGAGAVDAVANVALLLADWSHERAKLGLSFQGYSNDLVGFGLFDELVVLLDCCRSSAGPLIAMPCPLTPKFRTQPVATKQFVAYATQAGGESFEDPRRGKWEGVFTRSLLRVLRSSPGISAAALKDALKREVGGAPGRQSAEIVNGLDGVAPFGVGASCDLVIAFTAGCVGPVQLSDGRNLIAVRDPADGPWRIFLPTGLYKLRDAAGKVRLIDYPTESHVVF